MRIKDVYKYFRSYDKDTYEAFSCGANAPEEADVESFEREAGLRLPDAFRDFILSPLGGLHFAVQERLWPRPKAYDVGPFWSFLYGLQVFGIARDIPDWLDIRSRYSTMRDQGWPQYVPFLKLIGDPNLYCFTQVGTIVHWDHEQPYESPTVTESFPELLLKEIRELEERKDRKIREARS